MAKLLVNKKIAVETETGTRIIWNAIKKKKQFVDWEDFNLIFCKEIFREVLIALAGKIKTNETNSKEVALSGKLN